MHSEKRRDDDETQGAEELDALEREELRERLALEVQQFEQGMEG